MLVAGSTGGVGQLVTAKLLEVRRRREPTGTAGRLWRISRGALCPVCRRAARARVRMHACHDAPGAHAAASGEPGAATRALRARFCSERVLPLAQR